MRQELTEGDIVHLWTRWCESHDGEARDALIRHYLPTVESLSARLSRHMPESHRQDIYSFGLIGLMDAMDKFQPELGNRFETYGSRRIRGAMSDGIRTLSWLPRRAGQAVSRVIEKIVPVDFQTAQTAIGTRLEDALPDPDSTEWDDIELASDHAEVVEALDALPERERFVIVEHYYLHRRLADIGNELGVTDSRVCQLHRRALRMLETILLEHRTLEAPA
jgi:RNA polymerase sigma factor for flagellar operon FliA